TLAVNMAISLADTGKRVLLVDADFRQPSLGRIFNVVSATGLGSLLESSEPLPVTAIHHTGTPWLDLILSGPTRRNPSELLNGQNFIDLLGDLAERYDYVLLDSPPAVTFTDARTIAASCDATLMVIRGKAVNRPVFERARQGLMNIGANLAGVVINGETDSPSTLPAQEGALADRFSGRQLLRRVQSFATDVNLI
ncbi:MAG: CpsD/CapB family tyrosine-protein kinase, partial [Phycisphaerae bacterium]|nr:CpsD/CapB family tyrosine-protein kinase [Phycisphaerae bacterium]